jgi:CHAT domain-containing protein
MTAVAKYITLTLCFLAFKAHAQAQCPDRDSLYKRIIYLRDSTRPAPDIQLQQLQPYVERMERCHYTADSTYTTLLQRIGALYYLKGDLLQALPYTQRAISAIRASERSPAINRSHLFRCYFNLKMCFASLNLPAEANQAADSCIAIAVQTGSNDPRVPSVLAARVSDFFDIGDYHRCLQYADMYAHLPHDPSNEFMIEILLKKINALNYLNQYDAALRILKDNADLLERSSGGKFMGSMYGLRATANVGKANFDEALADFRRCFDISWKVGYLVGCAQALNNIGFLYQNDLRQCDNALPYYRKALAYADSVETLNILGNIANIYVQKGNWDSAFNYYHQAFGQVQPGRDISDYLSGLMLDQGDAWLRKYQADGSKADLVAAMAVYRSADRFFDSIKTRQSEIRSRLFWRSHTRRLFDHAIQVSYLSGNAADAFYFFEKSRAVLLEDQISEQHLSNASEILQLAQLKRNIQQEEQRLGGLSDTSARRADIEKSLFAKRQDLHLLEESIRSRNPVYYQSFLDTGVIDLPKAQTRLAKGSQSLIELFTGDSADYCLLITPQTARLSQLNKRDFDSTGKVFVSFLSDPARSIGSFDEFTRTASHLYRILFGDHMPPDGRIIVSQDGRWIPFEAIITKMTPAGPRYFVADHPVSYTYSFRYLTYSGMDRPGAMGSGLLGVAPVQYNAALHLPSLIGSDGSLDRISARFSHFTNLLSTHATRTNFLREFYRYPIIQLYTHASDSSNGRDEPVIYFSDSALYLSELIPESKPLTQLIVLSACETGSGQLYQGEGVFSFNRGFAALGIPSSIANLWAVEDQSTYRITELFYRYLSDGLPADKALQQAKLDFVGNGSGEKSLPYYWAAPVFAGDATFSIPRSSFWSRWSWPLGLLLVASLTILVLRRRHRRKPIPPLPFRP